MFKLGLWSALVFFEHGSDLQLAVALVINVLQLCAHVDIKPMGGKDAALLNLMQTCTLVLTTYINFGAIMMNSLALSQTLAHFVDRGSVDEYDAPIAAIGIIMQLLTFGLLLSFGGVGIKMGFAKAQGLRLDGRLSSMPSRIKTAVSSLRPGATGLPVDVATGNTGTTLTSNQKSKSSTGLFQMVSGAASSLKARFSSTEKEVAQIENRLSNDVEMTALPSVGRLPEGWTEQESEGGKPFFHNAATGKTSWTRP